VKIADARMYAGYRQDLTLDVRQMQVALRKLRAFAREGADMELDIDATIDATAKNAGEIDVVVRPPRRSSTRLILMMDVGGSMDPYAHLVSRLFTAAKKSTHWKELRSYYFHNCIYGRVYRTEHFSEMVSLHDLMAECGPHHKLIIVGDALMAPYELLQKGAALERGEPLAGIAWLQRLAAHFERSAWLTGIEIDPDGKLALEHHAVDNGSAPRDLGPAWRAGARAAFWWQTAAQVIAP
jgi:hypothetical protein